MEREEFSCVLKAAGKEFTEKLFLEYQIKELKKDISLLKQEIGKKDAYIQELKDTSFEERYKAVVGANNVLKKHNKKLRENFKLSQRNKKIKPELKLIEDSYTCALCGFFCDNAHHFNNWIKIS